MPIKKKKMAPQPAAKRTAKPARVLPPEISRVLVEVARNMRVNAHVPYSGYQVGAALLGASGLVYGGCNVENASYGLSICAERTAFVKAISEGERAFVAIVVATDDGGTPCGACRQFMAEFGLETTVILVDKRGRQKIYTVGDLLPDAFVLR